MWEVSWAPIIAFFTVFAIYLGPPVVSMAVGLPGRVTTLETQVAGINGKLDTLTTQVSHLTTEVHAMGQRLEASTNAANQRMDALGRRLDALGQRLEASADAANHRMDATNLRLDATLNAILLLTQQRTGRQE